MSTAAIAPDAPLASGARSDPVPQPGAVRLALARVEARRLLMHPLFIAGMAGSVVFVVSATGNAAESLDTLAGYCFTFIGAATWTCIAAGLAAGRERRDAAGDLYAGQPVTPRVRTQAAILSLGSAGLAAAALIAIAAVARTGFDGILDVDGERYALRPLELAQGPVYVMFAGALGVFIGTWTKRSYPLVLAALVLFLPPLAWAPWFVLGEHVPPSFDLDWLTGASVGWHLVGLAGLCVLAAAGALARHDRRPRVALLALASLLAMIAGLALGMPNPPPGT